MQQIEEVEQKGVMVLDQARTMVVTDEIGYIQAGEFIVGCKGLVSEIKAFFKPMKDAAFTAHRTICDRETTALKPVQQAIDAAGAAALPWKQEQDRLAREEAERQRQAMLKQREAEKLAEAEMLEKFGDTKAAEEKLQEAVIEPRRTRVESTIPKVTGLSTRKRWTFKFTDPEKVVRKYCEPDKQKIQIHIANYFSMIPRPTDEQVKKVADEISGIEVFQEETFAGRVAK